MHDSINDFGLGGDNVTSIKEAVQNGTILGHSFIVSGNISGPLACGTFYAEPFGIKKTGFYNQASNVGKAVILYELDDQVVANSSFRINAKGVLKTNSRNL